MKNPFKFLLSLFQSKRKPEPEMQISVFCHICKEPFNSPIEHIKGKPVIHKRCSPSADEMAIIKLPVEFLVNEYNLIKAKKSKLPVSLRKVVLQRIEFLKEKGDIKEGTSND